MKTLLIAERFNIGRRWPKADAMLERGEVDRWLEFALDVGCYGVAMTSRTQKLGAGRKKLEAIGVRFDDELDALNLLPPAECGAWDAALAKKVADQLRWNVVLAHDEREHMDCAPELDAWLYERVICVGRRVARAMEITASFFEPVGGAIVVPHPSGRNLWYNDPDARAEGARVMSEWYDPVPVLEGEIA
jgi:hypothetical protein